MTAGTFFKGVGTVIGGTIAAAQLGKTGVFSTPEIRVAGFLGAVYFAITGRGLWRGVASTVAAGLAPAALLWTADKLKMRETALKLLGGS